jgi:hypothetical protein
MPRGFISECYQYGGGSRGCGAELYLQQEVSLVLDNGEKLMRPRSNLDVHTANPAGERPESNPSRSLL